MNNPKGIFGVGGRGAKYKHRRIQVENLQLKFSEFIRGEVHVFYSHLLKIADLKKKLSTPLCKNSPSSSWGRGYKIETET